ncbi:MAG: hypothetical protein KA191_02255 [Verrucomicrobia bacterium]|nr:hypothetical protein [Verrucomicrobiota bacterium]MDI9381670.1 hypothetical protein [Verrucomicrobiota bacterium]NMD19712.1 hypothetical protein [Verrucomicrobiota bacterium]HOA60075.1 hypothetical protein [Verrucomicrobiota bacterium]HOF46827.1 hypothetical protein [Verrucomicrobiota bacterium]
MKKLLLTLGTLAACSIAAWADFVYVTATTSNCTDTAECRLNEDVNLYGGYVYNENSFGAFTTAVSLAPGKPATAGARYFSTSFMSGSSPDFGVTISPTLGIPGGVYRIYHVFSSAAGNVSADVVLGVTAIDGCTLSFTNTDKFQARFGVSSGGMNTWQFLGYLTNAAEVNVPTINFYWESGDVDAGAQHRLLIDTFLFVSDSCTEVPAVGISGSYVTTSTSVTVTDVDAAATAVKVYQYVNNAWTLVGQRTDAIAAGTLTVPVTGLVSTGQLAATQTIDGREGCLWGVPTGIVVGAVNPRVRLALSLRETPSTGPVGSAGVTTGGTTANIHFLGVTNRLTAAPGYPGQVLVPSSDGWQTVTFDAGIQRVGDSANATGTAVAGAGYNPHETVAIQVYAYRTLPNGAGNIYSTTPAESSAVTSTGGFQVNWAWDAVPGADGYRLLRDLNSGGYLEYVDVTGATTFGDANNAWLWGGEVTPNRLQTGPSVKWYTATGDPDAVGCISCLRSNWYTIDALAFAIDDLTSVGPHDIYIDTIENGTNVFYGFEASPAGTTDVGFRAPDFSGSTSGNLAGAPNSAAIVNTAAYEGTKSIRVQWAWNGLVNSKWLRLTTSGVGNPQVNVLDPITIRFLFVPDGGAMPAPPPAPNLSILQTDGQTLLDWVGGHRLQTAPAVTGSYTNVPGVTLAPYTNTFPEPQRFFRLVD